VPPVLHPSAGVWRAGSKRLRPWQQPIRGPPTAALSVCARSELPPERRPRTRPRPVQPLANTHPTALGRVLWLFASPRVHRLHTNLAQLWGCLLMPTPYGVQQNWTSGPGLEHSAAAQDAKGWEPARAARVAPIGLGREGWIEATAPTPAADSPPASCRPGGSGRSDEPP
jgi:hypothetical protein